MHVGVPDQHGENKSSDKLKGGFLSGFCPENRGDVGVTAAAIFGVRKKPKDLCKILRGNWLTTGNSVEPFDSDGGASFRPHLVREALDFCDGDKTVVRHSNTDTSRELKHHIFVFGNGREAFRGKLHDPGPAHAVCANR